MIVPVSVPVTCDILTGLSSEDAGAVDLDVSTLTDNVMRMKHVEHERVPASTEIIFRSGALQVTLLGLKQDLNLKDEIEITLHFQHYADLTVKVPVRNFHPPESEGCH